MKLCLRDVRSKACRRLDQHRVLRYFVEGTGFKRHQFWGGVVTTDRSTSTRDHIVVVVGLILNAGNTDDRGRVRLVN